MKYMMQSKKSTRVVDRPATSRSDPRAPTLAALDMAYRLPSVSCGCCGILFGHGPGIVTQELERRLHATCAMRRADEAQSHFNAAKRPAQRKVIKKPEMPDSENAAAQASQSHSERQIVASQNFAAESVRVVSFRHHDRG